MKSLWSVLIVTLVLLLSPAVPSVAQDGSGTVVFRAYWCPYGYADQFYPQTCELTGSSASIHLAADGTTVGEQVIRGEGATFAVPPGKYTLFAGIPGVASAHGPITCTSGGKAVSYPVNLMTGNSVDCEQFIYLSSGRDNPPDELDLTLTIRARSCDLAIPRSEFHGSCFDNLVSDALFYVSAYRFDTEVTTDANGNASVDVPDFKLEIDPTGDLFGARVWRFCSSAAHPGVPLLYPLNLAYHDGPVTCDIYFVPETYDLAPELSDPEAGTIEVHYRLCPPGFTGTTYYATCHDTVIPDAAIEIASDSGDVSAFGYTDQSGDVIFRVPSGDWVIPPDILGQPEDTYAVSCSETLDPTKVGHPIVVETGDEYVCDLYLIPTPSNSEAREISFVATTCTDGECHPARRLQILISSTPTYLPAVLDEYGYISVPLSEDSTNGTVTVTPFVFDGEVLSQFTCFNNAIGVTVEQIESTSPYQQYELVTRGHGDIACSLRIEH